MSLHTGVSSPTSSFVAIDFETANRNKASACSLGLAIVAEGAVASTLCWRFRPPELRFNAQHSRLHGITTHTAAGWPELADVWGQILPYLAGQLIVAHYAQFDIAVLQRSLDQYGIPYPRVEYTCTWLIAKRTWAGLGSYSLPNLASRLAVKVDHHEAGSDATACAHVLLAAHRRWRVASVAEVESRAFVARGALSPEMHQRASRQP